MIVCPDVFEVIPIEFAVAVANRFAVEDFVDSGGSPGGFEDEGVVEFRAFVVLEVQAYAEVVQVAAKLEGIAATGEAVLGAEFEELVKAEGVAGVGV